MPAGSSSSSRSSILQAACTFARLARSSGDSSRSGWTGSLSGATVGRCVFSGKPTQYVFGQPYAPSKLTVLVCRASSERWRSSPWFAVRPSDSRCRTKLTVSAAVSIMAFALFLAVRPQQALTDPTSMQAVDLGI